MYRLHRTMIVVVVLFVVAGGVEACSPAGHTFVAIASVRQLGQTEDVNAGRLAEILEKYRKVVYWGAEAPDLVARSRGYGQSHWKPLFDVDYEHPENFDLPAAQPYFTALLRGAHQCDYEVSAEAQAAHDVLLYQPPDTKLREVGLAFACGYISHLLSDYFCHYPAKVWWEDSADLREAVKEVVDSESYGVIQEVYAVMLWRLHADEYGLELQDAENITENLGKYHADNGVLPYCALTCSEESYSDWPQPVTAHIDVTKYDGCAAKMIQDAGNPGNCVTRESRRVEGIVEHIGMSMEKADVVSNELTDWRETYRRVIDMIVQSWADAAQEMEIEEPSERDVIESISKQDRQGQLIELSAEPGSRINLAMLRDYAMREYETRSGERGPVTGWGDPPSGARFDIDVFPKNGSSRLAIVTDGPWLKGHGPGWVGGGYNIRLPDTDHPIRFSANITMFNNPRGSDGVTFRVRIVDESGQSQTLYKKHWAQQQEKRITVDFSEFAGQKIELWLVSDAGPNDSSMRDWAAWIQPVVSVLPG